MSKSDKERLKELERRVEELEKRPLIWPVPWPILPATVPNGPFYETTPLWPTTPYRVEITCGHGDSDAFTKAIQ